MPKDNLRDKLDGNELDLSLNNLTEVPVKELAKIPKATHLDLSCNLLVELPDAFCQLRHLVKIDLSKNSLEALPNTFGQLEGLQHLDLLGNKLTALPISFFQLQRLRWLDLKDNPLDEEFRLAAGDCLDEDQCKKCAQNILQLMRQLNSNVERQRQLQLKRQRELEAQKKAAEKEQAEREQQRKRHEKQKEKERRRQEYEARRKKEQEQNRDSSSSEAESATTELRKKRRETKKSRPERHSCGVLSWFLLTLVMLALIAVAIVFHCNGRSEDPLCESYVQPALQAVEHLYSQAHKVVMDTLSSQNVTNSTLGNTS